MKKTKGFTLIELLVVIAIIGILAILIFIALGRAQKGARDAQRKAVCRDVATAEAMYYDTNKKYTGEWNVLRAGNTYLGQEPQVCPTATDVCDNPNSAWTGVLKKDSDVGFIVTANLETGGSFTCNKNGCEQKP